MKSVRNVTSTCVVCSCESHDHSPIQESPELLGSTFWLALPLKVIP